ncbi:hypothetical protein OHA21_41720 [Actinoplanes sp. NBC_00393]|uniref:hypothetical protein n=1 Tax=Actinoplanes sp. NBC_00393 TaxID=2975953 RepID=UPI002E1F32DD
MEGLTLGVATPVVTGQVAALVAKWVDQIQEFIRALLNNLRQLDSKLDKLNGLLHRMEQALRKIRRPRTSSVRAQFRATRTFSTTARHPMTLDNVRDGAGRMDWISSTRHRSRSRSWPASIGSGPCASPRTRRTTAKRRR